MNKQEISAKSSETLTHMQMHLLVKSTAALSINTLDNDTIIIPTAWVYYTDTNVTGNQVQVLSILDEDGTIYRTTSPSFYREFSDIFAAAKEDKLEKYAIKKTSGVSRSGRTYLMCKYCPYDIAIAARGDGYIHPDSCSDNDVSWLDTDC